MRRLRLLSAGLAVAAVAVAHPAAAKATQYGRVPFTWQEGEVVKA